MNIGLSTGYLENYWGDWFASKQIGGSENLVVQLSTALAQSENTVTVRLPYETDPFVRGGVRWIGAAHERQRYDLLFAFDQFGERDDAARCALVACRSDPPPHTNFDELIFLSRHHARLMGHPSRPSVGGGVDLDDYLTPRVRLPRRVICTSSPDRCSAALTIGVEFDFVHSYRNVGGYPSVELSRDELVDLQKTAQVLIYPLDPVRPSDFFSMAVLEAMAAGTPVVVSDADSMSELWSQAAIVLPRPIRLAEWSETVSDLLQNKSRWKRQSKLGLMKAAEYDWPIVASRYLKAAEAN